MSSINRRRTHAVVAGGAVAALAALAVAVPQAASATGDSNTSSSKDLIVLDGKNNLLRLDGDSYRTESFVRVWGLAKGDKLVAIDTRPATGQLYALGKSGQLYTFNAGSGKATKVGTPIAFDGKAVGFDFNPTVDRIRLVTAGGQNLRLVPDTGAVAATDAPLFYAVGDESEGETPKVSAAGYTDSVAGATTTALYGIDTKQDTLVLQGTVPGVTPPVSPNTGSLTTVGDLGVNISEVNGFDITGGRKDLHRFDAADYKAIAAVTGPFGFASVLVDVDLTDGDTYPVKVVWNGVVGLTFAS